MWARLGEETARRLLSPTLAYSCPTLLHHRHSALQHVCHLHRTAPSSFALPYVISLVYHACQLSTHYCTTRHHATPYFSACPYQHPAYFLSRHSPHLAHKGPLLPPRASPRFCRGRILPQSAALFSSPTDIHTHTHTHTHIHTHTHTHIHTQKYVQRCAVQLFIYICTCIHTYIHIYAHSNARARALSLYVYIDVVENIL